VESVKAVTMDSWGQRQDEKLLDFLAKQWEQRIDAWSLNVDRPVRQEADCIGCSVE
jgi:hypothetical protein